MTSTEPGETHYTTLEDLMSRDDSDPDQILEGTTLTATNPLDLLVSRQMLYRVIDVFLTYLYPLYPLPHWPSLIRDLNIGRETQEGELEWTTMVIGLIGYTVAQVPCQVTGMSKADARDLVRNCTGAISGYLSEDYSDVSWMRREYEAEHSISGPS
jgi:hypothetical protein